MLYLLIFLGTEDYIDEERYIPFGYPLKDYLDSLAVHKLDLNHASLNELLKIPYIDRFTAESIIKHRPYRSKQEVKNIIGEIAYLKIKRYITVKEIKKKSFESRIGARLNSLDSIHLYSKAGVIYKDFSFYFLSEKDKEEKDFLDFFTFSLLYNPEKLRIIIGDYRLHFGNGLLFSHPYAYSASGKYLYQAERGTKPQTIFSENGVMRGTVFSYKLKNTNLYLFSCLTFYDAEIKEDRVIKIYYSKIRDDSFPKEYRNSLNEKVLGARIESKIRNWGVGGTYYNSRFSYPFAGDESEYSFSGDKLQGLSIDGFLLLKNYISLGEVSLSFPGEYGILYYGRFKRERFKGGFYIGYYKKLFAPHSRYYGLTKRYPTVRIGYSFSHSLEKLKIYFYGSGYRNSFYRTIPFYLKFEIERKEENGSSSLSIRRNFSYEEDRTYTFGIEKILKIYNTKIKIKLQDKKEPEGSQGWKFEGTVKKDFLILHLIYFYSETLPLYGYESMYRTTYPLLLEGKGMRVSFGINLKKAFFNLYGFYGTTFKENKFFPDLSINISLEF